MMMYFAVVCTDKTRRLLHRWSIISTIFCACTGVVYAGEDADDDFSPLIEDFFLIEAVYPQEEGEPQLTLTSYYSDSDDEGGGFLETLGMEYGLSDQLQIEANVSVWLDRDPPEESGIGSQSGLGDAEVGFKYTFIPDNPDGLWLAAGLEVVIPSGDVDKALGDGYWVYEPYIVVARDIDAMTHLALNMAYGFRSRDDEAAFLDEDDEGEEGDELELGLGVVRAFGPAWRGVVEVVWETDKLDGGSERETNAALGLKYKGVENIELGVSLDVDLTGERDDPGLLFDVSYEP